MAPSAPKTSRLYWAAAASGAAIAASFLRFWLYPLAWVAFVPLLWALRQTQSARQAARVGYVAGLVTNLPAFYWLAYTFEVFGGFPYAVAIALYALLTILTATEFLLFAVAWRRVGFGALGLAAPFLWVSLEFLFPNEFPWRMGHTQWQVPALIQIGEITGPYGLSFVIVWFASAVTYAILESQRRFVPLLAASAAAIALFVYGEVRLPQVDAAIAAAPTLRVALVQGNVGLKEKGDVRYFDVNLDKYQDLSAELQDRVDLIVWPETVNQHWIPVDATTIPPKENPFGILRTNLIFGGLSFRLTGPDMADEFNSAFLMGPGAQLRDRYDKRILMPFGEYIPLGEYFPWIYKLSPETGHFTSGSQVAVFDIGGKAKVGQLICYEDIVSNMPRHTTEAGAQVLINILNDAWYGDSAAPYQHQALALWRTVENRRYLLRGSNSGVTAVIDAAGRVVAQGGLFTTEVVEAPVHLLDLQTFYTRFGDVFAWSVVAIAALLLWRTRA